MSAPAACEETDIADLTETNWAALRALQRARWPRRVSAIPVVGKRTEDETRADLHGLVRLGLAEVTVEVLPSFQLPPPGPEESFDMTPLGRELLALRVGFLHAVPGCNGHTDWESQADREWERSERTTVPPEDLVLEWVPFREPLRQAYTGMDGRQREDTYAGSLKATWRSPHGRFHIREAYDEDPLRWSESIDLARMLALRLAARYDHNVRWGNVPASRRLAAAEGVAA